MKLSLGTLDTPIFALVHFSKSPTLFGCTGFSGTYTSNVKFCSPKNQDQPIMVYFIINKIVLSTDHILELLHIFPLESHKILQGW